MAASVVNQGAVNATSPEQISVFRGPVHFIAPSGGGAISMPPDNPSPPPAVTAAVFQIIEAPFGRMLP